MKNKPKETPKERNSSANIKIIAKGALLGMNNNGANGNAINILIPILANIFQTLLFLNLSSLTGMIPPKIPAGVNIFLNALRTNLAFLSILPLSHLASTA